MPAVARNRRPMRGTLAVRSTILAARRRRTVASRMRTLFNFLLGHRKLPWHLFLLPKSIRPHTPKMRPQSDDSAFSPNSGTNVMGTVLDQSGAKIPGARLQMQIQGSESLLVDITADENGRFRLPKVQRGALGGRIVAP